MSNKILFICKRREDYSQVVHSAEGLQTGLYNSITFMVNHLAEKNIESKSVVVIDNNDIDREIAKYKPTHVIIEALWVVPSKFAELCALHPNVQWIIRLHSETPFLASEGMAWDWLGDYVKFPNIKIACNSPRMLFDTRAFLKVATGWDKATTDDRVIYLPNSYPFNFKIKYIDYSKDTIDIGCFGAVRPLKNTMIQAIAAVNFANQIHKKLRFHINARVELQGDPIVRNLKSMFQHLADSGPELVFHKWTPHQEFLNTCSKMDIGLQVSFTETFNIVGADIISQGVPLVTSSDLPWAHKNCFADPTDALSISKKLIEAYYHPKDNVLLNQDSLKKYCQNSIKEWVNYFGEPKSKNFLINTFNCLKQLGV